jgi:hypothetical protein
MNDQGLQHEVYRYDADAEYDRELDRTGVFWGVVISTLFWVGIGYAIWSRL